MKRKFCHLEGYVSAKYGRGKRGEGEEEAWYVHIQERTAHIMPLAATIID